jgi:hypothetical protein
MYVPVSILALTHVITSCPLYNEIRKEYFVKIKGTVITAIGFDSLYSAQLKFSLFVCMA